MEGPGTDAPLIHADRGKLEASLATLAETIVRSDHGGSLTVRAAAQPSSGLMDIRFESPTVTTVPERLKRALSCRSGYEFALRSEEFTVFTAKSFIEVMNGSLSVEAGGSGLLCTVRLPLAEMGQKKK